MGLVFRVRKYSSILISLALILTSLTLLVSPAKSAPNCDPVNPRGKTIGNIQVGDVRQPIKAFNYPQGGVMEPQGTTLAAGLSLRHMPLNSTLGTSVITWHVNYKGCVSPLNVLMSREVGSTFRITDEDGVVTRYRIDRKLVVEKGDYRKSWFQLIGPRKLVLFTCTGEFRNGHYTDNMVFIATPVE